MNYVPRNLILKILKNKMILIYFLCIEEVPKYGTKIRNIFRKKAMFFSSY